MPRAFWICYLKSLCIFPKELKLQPKIPQISRKCLEAKFRGRFRQVQQMNVKEKNYGQFPEVLIKLYKKFWAISTIKWKRKKICRKTKKLQFDRVILRPGWNLPYEPYISVQEQFVWLNIGQIGTPYLIYCHKNTAQGPISNWRRIVTFLRGAVEQAHAALFFIYKGLKRLNHTAFRSIGRRIIEAAARRQVQSTCTYPQCGSPTFRLQS